MPSRLRTNNSSSACLASSISLNFFNSFFVIFASPVSRLFCVLSLCPVSFFLFASVNGIRRRDYQKGSPNAIHFKGIARRESADEKESGHLCPATSGQLWNRVAHDFKPCKQLQCQLSKFRLILPGLNG